MGCTFNVSILLFYKSMKLPLKVPSGCKGGVRPLAGVHLNFVRSDVTEKVDLPSSD